MLCFALWGGARNGGSFGSLVLRSPKVYPLRGGGRPMGPPPRLVSLKLFVAIIGEILITLFFWAWWSLDRYWGGNVNVRWFRPSSSGSNVCLCFGVRDCFFWDDLLWWLDGLPEECGMILFSSLCPLRVFWVLGQNKVMWCQVGREFLLATL